MPSRTSWATPRPTAAGASSPSAARLRHSAASARVRDSGRKVSCCDQPRVARSSTMRNSRGSSGDMCMSRIVSICREIRQRHLAESMQWLLDKARPGQDNSALPTGVLNAPFVFFADDDLHHACLGRQPRPTSTRSPAGLSSAPTLPMPSMPPSSAIAIACRPRFIRRWSITATSASRPRLWTSAPRRNCVPT
ncbi:hypothetical protein D3C84_823520 [compost metagenome]